jgi:hypothetical protein
MNVPIVQIRILPKYFYSEFSKIIYVILDFWAAYDLHASTYAFCNHNAGHHQPAVEHQVGNRAGAHGDRELRSWITIRPGSGPYWQPCTEIR